MPLFLSEADVKCAYCGKDGPWRTHSGVFECGACWDWRKLDSRAARYWYILSRMVGSSVDTYDLTRFFPKSLEFTEDEIKAFTAVIGKMARKTGELAKEHHVDERWQQQAQELFEQLGYGIRPKPVPEHDCDENREVVSGHGLRCKVCDRPILP